MFEVMARIGFIGAMRDAGCNLSNREVEEVVRTEAACLAENGRERGVSAADSGVFGFRLLYGQRCEYFDGSCRIVLRAAR